MFYIHLTSLFFRFLGQVNSQGTAFKAPTLSTGLGSYIAQVGNTVVSKSTVKPSIIIVVPLGGPTVTVY